MPPAKLRPGVGQAVLPGMPELEVSPITRELGIQRNFASLARPEVWGLEQAHFTDLTERELSAADTIKLRPSLIGVQLGSKGAVGFPSVDETGARQRLHVALNPIEFGHVTRSIEALGSAVANRTLAVRAGNTGLLPHESVADRSGVHGIEVKKEKMELYLHETLEPENERLSRFLEYASHNWLRRGKAVNMLIEMAWIQEQIFGNMLSVIGRQRNWTNEQAALARQAVEYRLFFDRQGNRHITYWRQMLGLAQDYNQAKMALYKDRIYQSKRYIREHAE